MYDKDFQFVKIAVQQDWEQHRKRGSAYIGTSQRLVYEMKWRSQGSSRWGKTELKSNADKHLTYKEAIKLFFVAIKASEKMEFREL